MEALARFNHLSNELLSGDTPLYAGHMLARAAQRWPERAALTCGDESVTYQQLHQQASSISHYLQQQGVVPGDRVMLLYENSINFYRAYHGAWQIGAVVVPINVFMHEKSLST